MWCVNYIEMQLIVGKLEEEWAATVLQEAIKGDLAKNLTAEHRTETLRLGYMVEEHSRQSRQQMQIP